MKSKSLLKLTLIAAAIGLAMIFSVIISGVAYPNMFYRIVTPLGLLFVFVSVILGFISWLWYLKNTIKSKQYILAIIVAAPVLIVLIKEFIRIL